MAQLVSLVLQVVDVLGVRLPTWAFGLALVALAAFLLPARVRGERANRARRILLRASAAGSVAERDRLEAEALAEVRGDEHGLLTIASWAVDRGRYPLAQRVLDEPKLAGHPERRKLLAQMHRGAPLDTESLVQKVLKE